MKKFSKKNSFIMAAMLSLVLAAPAFAGASVFNTPDFVEPGKFALGLEADVTLTDGSGVAGKLHYSHGISDIINVHALVGPGGGKRGFRMGAGLIFDFFPDTAGQPGIGLGTNLKWIRISGDGQLEALMFPYVHETFKSGNTKFSPFISIPFGFAFNEGQYTTLAQFAFGSSFVWTKNLSYIVELGIEISNIDSYIAAGLSYRH